MRNFEVSATLMRTLKKLSNRDARYRAVFKKMDEILSCDDVTRYKNLRSPLQRYKRVHIDGSFVLAFQHDARSDRVRFVTLEHHDTVYA